MFPVFLTFESNNSKSSLKSNSELIIFCAGVIWDARVSLVLGAISSCALGFICINDWSRSINE